MDNEYDLIIGKNNMGTISGAEAAGEAFIAATNLAHVLNQNVILINKKTGEIINGFSLLR